MIKKYCLLLTSFVLLFTIAFVFLAHVNTVEVDSNPQNGQLDVTIKYFIPVSLVKSSSSVSAQYLNHLPHWYISQVNNNTFDLKIQENIPYGQEYKLSAAYKPLNLPITFHTKKIVRNNIVPKLISPSPRVIPTDQPVELQFNTFINPASFVKNANASLPGTFVPARWDNTDINNYSKWLFKPDKPLLENQQVEFYFRENIKSINGNSLTKNITYKVTTAEKPKIVDCSITDGSTGVNLYPQLKISFSQKLINSKVVLKEDETNHNILGKTKLANNEIIYKPEHALLPDTKYNLSIIVMAETREKSKEYNISFTTKKMNNKYWLDAKLGNIHTLTVYKGRYPISVMIASGGRSGHETPLGTYYTSDRGRSFWAPRFGEGATYWIRIVGSILIHSVPKNAHWITKKEEHLKLGLPASHGCIRLAEPDAKWLYENIPAQTMVIIHE
ncbi:MAG: hypothetical protein FH758_13975 [Firmicutes bacterium]|nr:hypothetical protein [Bacillota bacterium]